MINDFNNKKKGFTLIELLIVVAIIAILAAIAIPNFLAAQIRAKVSRIKGEFNTLGTALEAYNVDENTYPIYKSATGQNGVFGKDDYNPCRFDVLTTPVGYITSIPKDPFYFSGHDAKAEWGIGYFLYTWNRFWRPQTGETMGGTNGPGPFSDIYHASYWSLWSVGPYGKFIYGYPGTTAGVRTYIDEPPFCAEGDVTLVSYDPSNGVGSKGGIFRTSKKGSI